MGEKKKRKKRLRAKRGWNNVEQSGTKPRARDGDGDRRDRREGKRKEERGRNASVEKRKGNEGK